MATSKKTTVKKATAAKSIEKAALQKTATANSTVPDHFIDLKTAIDMTKKAWKKYNRKPIDFSSQFIKEILSQEGVIGLRIYDAINSAGEQTYVLTGQGVNGADIMVKRKVKKTPIKSAGLRGGDGNNVLDYEEGAGDMGQVCDPVKQTYQPEDMKAGKPGQLLYTR